MLDRLRASATPSELSAITHTPPQAKRDDDLFEQKLMGRRGTP